jgi:predicted NAD/FAD-dependent oxidoreductase
MVEEWGNAGLVSEWSGSFTSINGGDFFGLPSKPPFYTSVGGMNTLANALMQLASRYSNADTQVHLGQRVNNISRDTSTGLWTIHGTKGAAAFHDTSEEVARRASVDALTSTSYDAVVLTDVSSSFGQWHRASAGVPASFSKRVRERAGSRVPLFATMVTFEECFGEVDAVAMNHPTLWFAAKTSSKKGLESVPGHEKTESWTLVSSPSFAAKLIEETPMQTPDGTFIPQVKLSLHTNILPISSVHIHVHAHVYFLF